MTDLTDRLRDGCVLRDKRFSGDTFEGYPGGDIDEDATKALMNEAAEALRDAEYRRSADLLYTMSWFDKPLRQEFLQDPDGARIFHYATGGGYK